MAIDIYVYIYTYTCVYACVRRRSCVYRCICLCKCVYGCSCVSLHATCGCLRFPRSCLANRGCSHRHFDDQCNLPALLWEAVMCRPITTVHNRSIGRQNKEIIRDPSFARRLQKSLDDLDVVPIVPDFLKHSELWLAQGMLRRPRTVVDEFLLGGGFWSTKSLSRSGSLTDCQLVGVTTCPGSFPQGFFHSSVVKMENHCVFGHMGIFGYFWGIVSMHINKPGGTGNGSWRHFGEPAGASMDE